MRQDDNNIFDAYQKSQQLNEAGVAAAKWEAAKKSFSPTQRLLSFGQRQAAKVAQGLGDKNAAKSLLKKSKETKSKIASAGEKAKIDSIVRTHAGQIDGIADEIVRDLDSLGLNANKITKDDLAKDMIERVRNNTLARVEKTPPPIPSAPEDIEYSPADTGGGTPVEAEPDVEIPDEEPEDIEYSEADTGGGTPVEAEPDVEIPDEPTPAPTPEAKPEEKKEDVVTYGGKPGKPQKPNNIAITRKSPFRFDRRDYRWAGINGWINRNGISVDTKLQKAITDSFLKKFPKEVQFKK